MRKEIDIILTLSHLTATGGGRFRSLISDFLFLCNFKPSGGYQPSAKTKSSSLHFNNNIINNDILSAMPHLGIVGRDFYCHYSSAIRTAKKLMYSVHHAFSFRNFNCKNNLFNSFNDNLLTI